MRCAARLGPRPILFLIYVNDTQESSDKINFFLFADDATAVYADKNLKSLESIVIQELCKLLDWLTANKLTLNIKKTNFVTFRPAQRKRLLRNEFPEFWEFLGCPRNS